MKGVLSTVDLDDASLVAKAKASPGLVGRDLVREVLPDQPQRLAASRSARGRISTAGSSRRSSEQRASEQTARTSWRSTSA